MCPTRLRFRGDDDSHAQDLAPHELAVAGLVLTVIGFYLDHADAYPLILAVVPGYSDLRQGLDRIQETGQLGSDDPHFATLKTVVERNIEQLADSGVPRPVIVERFERGPSTLGFSQDRAPRAYLGLRVAVAGRSEPISLDLTAISDAIDSHARELVGRFGVIIFWLGIIVTIGTSVLD